MTAKTVEWVAPEINEHKNQYGITYYVNCAFADKDSGSVGKKDRDKALEIQGLLMELKGKEVEFTLESTGRKNKDGLDIWTILAFPGYTAPAKSQGGGGYGGSSSGPRPRSPEEHDSINRAVALKAAVRKSPSDAEPEEVLVYAQRYYEWLSAGPASPAETAGVETHPSEAPPATTSAVQGSGGSEGAEVQGDGEASCPPHQPDMSVEPKGPGGRRPCLKCKAWVKS